MMKKKIRLSIAVLFFVPVSLCILDANGQERYQPDKVIPPSPTAASLGVYGDMPVSYYTGTPDVSVPIYEIKTTRNKSWTGCKLGWAWLVSISRRCNNQIDQRS